MVRRRTADLDVAVDAGRKGTLGTGDDRHGRSSAAIREWIGHATCRSQIRDQRAREGHPGPAPGRGAIDGRRKEEPCTLGSSAHSNHVGCQGREWTVDGVVSTQLAVIHPDIAARDLEPSRADATLGKEHIAREVAVRTSGMNGAARPRDTAEKNSGSDETTRFHSRCLVWQRDRARRELAGVDHGAELSGQLIDGAREVCHRDLVARRTIEGDTLER